MTDISIVATGAFVVLWGFALAAAHARLSDAALLRSLAAMCLALLTILILGPTMAAADDRLALSLGAMIVPGVIAAHGAMSKTTQA